MKAGSKTEITLHVRLKDGYHVNSNHPSDEYLIPLRLAWTPDAKIWSISGVFYPKPSMEKYSFSETPLSVFTGNFDIRSELTIQSDAPLGQNAVSAKLRYQACTDRMCLPPKTVDVTVPADIVK